MRRSVEVRVPPIPPGPPGAKFNTASRSRRELSGCVRGPPRVEVHSVAWGNCGCRFHVRRNIRKGTGQNCHSGTRLSSETVWVGASTRHKVGKGRVDLFGQKPLSSQWHHFLRTWLSVGGGRLAPGGLKANVRSRRLHRSVPAARWVRALSRRLWKPPSSPRGCCHRTD